SEDVVVLVVPGTATSATVAAAPATTGATSPAPAASTTSTETSTSTPTSTSTQTASADTGPVAVLVPGNASKGSTVLQTPTSDQTTAPGQLSLDVVDYDDLGRVVIGGHGAPGMMVQLYIDNVLAGRATTGGDGRWQIRPGQKVDPGLHRMRADEI